jgi:predicted RNA-binding protein associated with RNAse of E/G family
MKKIRILVALLIISAAYCILSARTFENEVKKVFPEAQGLSTTLFIPWPFGPKWISNVKVNHPLYVESQIEGNGTILIRDGYRVVVMASDGTIIAERNSNKAR